MPKALLRHGKTLLRYYLTSQKMMLVFSIGFIGGCVFEAMVLVPVIVRMGL